MSRPFKCRRIGFLPDVTYFKPAGIPLRNLEEISLTLSEAEALRLKDLEGLAQEQAAEKMSISRPTFQRILASARQKVADALLNGKAIQIEGGNIEVVTARVKCVSGHEWDIPADSAGTNTPVVCPVCQSAEIARSTPNRPGQPHERGSRKTQGTIKQEH
jgi:predicted DNA-binding protein (UPF0251 family)